MKAIPTKALPIHKLADMAPTLYTTRQTSGAPVPLDIRSRPGDGKTSFVEGVFKKRLEAALNVPCHVLTETLASMEHLDLRGYAVATKDKDGTPITVWTKPDLVQRLETINAQHAGACSIILFLDEAWKAEIPAQKVLATMLSDRRIGAYPLPDNVWIITASNNRDDRSGDNRTLGMVQNRITTVHTELPHDVWADWAVEHDIPPLVMSAANQFPQMFATSVPAEGAFCTRRTLSFAGAFLAQAAKHLNLNGTTQLPLGEDFPAQTALVDGWIGMDARVLLEQHMRVGRLMPTIADIVRDPVKAKAPPEGRLDAQYAIAMMLMSHKDIQDYDMLWQYAEKNLPAHFLTLIGNKLLKRTMEQPVGIPSLHKWLHYQDSDGNRPNLELVQASLHG